MAAQSEIKSYKTSQSYNGTKCYERQLTYINNVENFNKFSLRPQIYKLSGKKRGTVRYIPNNIHTKTTSHYKFCYNKLYLKRNTLSKTIKLSA